MKIKMKYLQWVAIGALLFLAAKHDGSPASVLYVCAAVLILVVPILINRKI